MLSPEVQKNYTDREMDFSSIYDEERHGKPLKIYRTKKHRAIMVTDILQRMEQQASTKCIFSGKK